MALKSVDVMFRNLDFWKRELPQKVRKEDEPYLEKVEEFMEDSGHKMLAICMNHENEFKEAVANDMCFYFNTKIKEMLDLIESGDFNLRHVINCENINKYHQKLIKKYENIKMKIEE